MARRKLNISKSFIGRAVAVGLFVCLGTFAVIQSINGRKPDLPDDVANAHTHDGSEDVLTSEAPGIEGALPADNSPTINQTTARPASYNQEITNPADVTGDTPDRLANDLNTINQPPENFPSSTGSTPPAFINSESNPAVGIDSPQPESIQSGQNQFGGSTTETQSQFGGNVNTTSDSFPQPPPLQSDNALPPNFAPQNDSTANKKQETPFNPGVSPSAFPDNNSFPPNISSENSQFDGKNSLPPAQNNPTDTDNSNTLPNALPTNSLPSNSLPSNSLPSNSLPSNSFSSNTLPANNILPSNNELPSNTLPANEMPANDLPTNNFGTTEPAPESKSGQPFSNDLRSVPSQTKTSPPNVPSVDSNLPANNSFPANNTPNVSTGNTALPSNAGTQNIRQLSPTTPPIQLATLDSNPRIEGVQTPSLTLQKLAPREIQVNQPGDFELVVRNVGQTTAENVVVYDKIPANVEVLEMTPQPTSNQNGSVSWNLGRLAPAEEKRIKMRLKPTSPGELDSVAQFTFTALAGSRTKITQPVLNVSHSAPERSLIGDRVVLDILVENKGDGPATNVVIQETIPDRLKYSTQNGDEKEIEFVVGTLLPGQQRRIPLTLTAQQVGHVRNLVVAHADGELTAQHAVEMEIVAPTIGVSASGHNRRLMGRPAVHTFTVKNTGTAAATNVELVTKLPRGVRFQSANHHGNYNPATHSVVWSLAELGPRIEGTVELTTIPVASGNQTIEFLATADLNQRESTQVSYEAYQIAELYFEIDDVTDALEIGAETVYSIRVVNQGAKAATNVQLSVDFAAGITPFQVDGKNLPETNGQKVQFTSLPNLGPGQEKRYTIRARGVTAGDHRVVASLSSDERQIAIKKEEVTHVYADQIP